MQSACHNPAARLLNPASLWLALVLAALMGCSHTPSTRRLAPSTNHLAASHALLPASLEENLFIVEVLINGQGPFRMILDTGASGLVLGARSAEKAGLRLLRAREALILDAAGRQSHHPLATASQLQAGVFRVDNPSFVLLPQNELLRIQELSGTRFDGILGINVFAGLVLELDYPAQTIRVCEPALASLPEATAQSYSGIVPRLPVNVQGHTRTFAIDTGAEYFFALSDLDSVPLVYPKDKNEFPSVQAGGTTRDYRSQLAGSISLGSAQWQFPPLQQSADNRLGAPALARSRLTIDCARQRLWIENDAPMCWDTDTPLEKDGRAISVGALLLPARNGWRVGEIDAGGRAERAGLRTGDRITAVRGLNSGNLPHSSPFRAGYKHRLTVERAGTPFECMLDLTAP